jgi:hypothetical protein
MNLKLLNSNTSQRKKQMSADMIIDYDAHLKNGCVWRVNIALPMQDSPEDVPNYLDVSVDVVAPNRDLAQYIVSVMYPDYDTLSIPDDPLN